MYRRNQKMIAVLLLLFFSLGICGCQDKARRPITDKNELAPEAVKYDKEPTISLYRKKADSKEDIKLEKELEVLLNSEKLKELFSEGIEELKQNTIINGKTNLGWSVIDMFFKVSNYVRG